MRPAIAVCGIGEDLEGAIRKDQPGAGMVGESCFPGGMMGADDAQDRIAVGQTERRKPKPLCRDHQFFEVRSSAQEGEARLPGENPVYEPARRSAFPRREKTLPVKPVAPLGFVFDAIIIAWPDFTVAPPFRLDAFRAFDCNDPLQRSTPAKGDRRTFRRLGHGFDRFRPLEKPDRARQADGFPGFRAPASPFFRRPVFGYAGKGDKTARPFGYVAAG